MKHLRKTYSPFTKFLTGPGKSWSFTNFAQCIAYVERHTFSNTTRLKQAILIRHTFVNTWFFYLSLDGHMFINFTRWKNLVLTRLFRDAFLWILILGVVTIELIFLMIKNKFSLWNWHERVQRWWIYIFTGSRSCHCLFLFVCAIEWKPSLT